jgi:hypothetical protein
MLQFAKTAIASSKSQNLTMVARFTSATDHNKLAKPVSLPNSSKTKKHQLVQSTNVVKNSNTVSTRTWLFDNSEKPSNTVTNLVRHTFVTLLNVESSNTTKPNAQKLQSLYPESSSKKLRLPLKTVNAARGTRFFLASVATKK